MDSPKLEDLTKEKNMWHILWAAKCIHAPLWQQTLFFLCVVAVLIYVCLTDTDPASLAVRLRSCLGLAFNSAVALLGFLLAGFTFFASFGDKSLFLHSAKRSHDKFNEMSWLKYFMFTFVKTIFLYFAFVILSLFTLIVGSKDGPISEMLRVVDDKWEPAFRHFVVSAGYVIFLPFFVFLLTILSSFIYNVYHVTMLSIQWEWAKQDKEKYDHEGE